MHALVRQRSQWLGLPVWLLQLLAEDPSVDSGPFDCVVCTYTLCSVDDPFQTLRKMRRVRRLWHASRPSWSRTGSEAPELLAQAVFTLNWKPAM